MADGDTKMWFATDPLNDDTILGYHRADNTRVESLLEFLTKLRDKYGIHPRLFTCDDANVFDHTPQKVWPECPVQVCHFHVIKHLVGDYLRKSLAVRIKKYKPVKPKKVPWPDGRKLAKKSRGYMSPAAKRAYAKYKEANASWIELHRRRRLFFKTKAGLKKKTSRKRKETKFIKECCSKYPAIDEFRRVILDFYKVMDSPGASVGDSRRQAFIETWKAVGKRDSKVNHVVKLFNDDWWFGRLFPFTEFENAHRTTNSTERANRWFRKRQKTHYRCRKEHTITRMLHADLVYRRKSVPNGEPPRVLILKERHKRKTG